MLYKNPNAGKFQRPEGYRDIGWQMSENNKEYMACINAKHKRREFDNSSYQSHCTNMITICDECKIFWHTDMSD